VAWLCSDEIIDSNSGELNHYSSLFRLWKLEARTINFNEENMMKKILFCLLLALPSLDVFADELKNFDELKSAIQNGKTIKLVFLLNKCEPSREKVLTAVSSPTSFMLFDDRISTSVLRFTRNEPRYLGKSIFEFFTYTFSQDNHMLLRLDFLNAPDYALLGNAPELNCVIGSSVKIFSQDNTDT
jgi:hypothetical protein